MSNIKTGSSYVKFLSVPKVGGTLVSGLALAVAFAGSRRYLGLVLGFEANEIQFALVKDANDFRIAPCPMAFGCRAVVQSHPPGASPYLTYEG